MLKIEIQADSKFPVDRKLIRKRVGDILAEHKLTDKTEVGIFVVGKRKMAELNKMYMKKNGPTDVLSFPLNDPNDDTPFVSAPDGVLRLGDIMVCYSIAIEQAFEKQVMVDEQVVSLIEHGLLHLLGIHHD